MEERSFAKIGAMVEKVDDLVWGPGMLALLLGTGMYLMVRLHFLPLKNLKYALLCTVGKEKNRQTDPVKRHSFGERRKGAGHGGTGVSSFSSLTTELAATIGTGNIVGVATAMVLGGPGALLWMMVSSLLGMAVKLVESMLSVKYRSRNERNEFAGGPMYTMARGLPNRRLGKLLGTVFAVFTVMTSFGMGNMTQSNSIAEALKVTFDIPVYRTGLIVTVITILVVLGGIKNIAKVTRVLVPFMGIFYLVGTFGVILTHWQEVPEGLWQIVKMAVCPRAVYGGAGGQICVSVSKSLRWGVSRGVFSNEAGLGASGISAAAADTADPVHQGYISMTGVFLDTMVICFLTGLAIAASGVLGSVDGNGQLLTGTALTIEVFCTAFGEMGGAFVSICIVLFAFATIVGWAYQGEKAFEFLMGTRYCICYRFFYGLITYVGTVCSFGIVWDFSDICNALMAVPNLICVLWMSKEACRDILAYENKKSNMAEYFKL